MSENKAPLVEYMMCENSLRCINSFLNNYKIKPISFQVYYNTVLIFYTKSDKKYTMLSNSTALNLHLDQNVKYDVEIGRSFAGIINQGGYNTYCLVETPI